MCNVPSSDCFVGVSSHAIPAWGKLDAGLVSPMLRYAIVSQKHSEEFPLSTFGEGSTMGRDPCIVCAYNV